MHDPVITLNGKKYPLVLTVAGMIELEDQYGSMEKLIDALTVEHLPDRLTVLTNSIVSMANQGMILQTGNTRADNPDLLTRDSINLLHARPIDFAACMNAAIKAFNIGMGTETGDNGEEIDVVLDEIRKNAEGAAV